MFTPIVTTQTLNKISTDDIDRKGREIKTMNKFVQINRMSKCNSSKTKKADQVQLNTKN